MEEIEEKKGKETWLTEELKQVLTMLFENLIDPFLLSLRKSLSESIATSDLQLVVSLCNLLECFFTSAFPPPFV